MISQLVNRVISLLSILAILFTACEEILSPEDSGYEYRPPEEAGDGYTHTSFV
jgi:hypothetical protein